MAASEIGDSTNVYFGLVLAPTEYSNVLKVAECSDFLNIPYVFSTNPGDLTIMVTMQHVIVIEKKFIRDASAFHREVIQISKVLTQKLVQAVS